MVIWEWEWQVDDDVTHVSETEGITHISESFSHTSDTTNLSDEVKESSDTECYTEKLFTVIFKCIGCQHDRCAQEALKYVSESMDKGEVIPVNIFPEENNPYDARAIAFKCWIADKWQRIGYVVKEAINAVHDARDQKLITEVSFKWAKYLVSWTRSGPAYYAGINITKYRDWPSKVYACASTR